MFTKRSINIDVWEGIWPTIVDELRKWVREEFVRLGKLVPEPVELGYHLCDGDHEGKYGVYPTGTSNMVIIARAIIEGAGRPVNWLHMPGPKNRDDDAFFAPLADLKLRADGGLYLGLVYDSDEEGTRRHMAAADRHWSGYGISAVCGMGRRDPATVPGLLALHSCCVGQCCCTRCPDRCLFIQKVPSILK